MRDSPRWEIIELFTKHRSRLQQYLYSRLNNEADAQELAQEAYLRLLRISEKKLIRHPQSYLYRIATNLVYELYAVNLPANQRLGEATLEELEDPMVPLEETVERRRHLQRVDKALSELSPKCQAVVNMRSRQGMTNKEIATKLDISVEMVKKYMANGVAHCRKRLRRFNYDKG